MAVVRDAGQRHPQREAATAGQDLVLGARPSPVTGPTAMGQPGVQIPGEAARAQVFGAAEGPDG